MATSNPLDEEEDSMRRGKPTPSTGWTTEESPLTNSSSAAKPGRAQRRPVPLPPTQKKKKPSSPSWWSTFSTQYIKGYSPLLFAVMLWYLLGVVSIGTSKVLLMEPKHHHEYIGNVPPLFLTLQQLFLGSNFLRYLLRIRAFGSVGLQPFPSDASPKSRKAKPRSFWKSPRTDLIMAGIYFGLGFLSTNYSFQRSSAAFVETIKAAEPITSAAVAVAWGIEKLGPPEVSSLLAIVSGVLLSTYGNAASGDHASSLPSFSDSLKSCLVVMTANLCFSFRGLHQKLFRASSQGNSSEVDDLNLQFRMQQLGVYLLAIPVLVWNVPSMIQSVWELHQTVGLVESGVLVRYLSLALVNGLAFTSYNLASTFILTRISVVHHAALNCIRRIFAIVVTSFLFGIPITAMGAAGVVISFVGFLCFTHYKAKRLRQPKQISSLLPMSSTVSLETATAVANSSVTK